MANKIDLGGRTAGVTGGAQGIGRAIAKRLPESGAAVAIWDRDRNAAEECVFELRKVANIMMLVCDVTEFAGAVFDISGGRATY